MHLIRSKKKLATNTYLYEVEAPYVAKARKPGQFLVLRIREGGERIPLTIAGGDAERGIVRFCVQAVGKTTFELSELEAGDHISDVVGPLGVPTHIERYGTVVLMGGGYGTAAIIPVAQEMKRAGNRVVSVIGARSKDLIIMEDELGAASDLLRVTTDDGSYGLKGFVTDALKQIIEEEKDIGFVMAVGPIPMMKAVSEMTRPHGIKTMVSLNTIMVDGTGMCGSCRCTVGGVTKFACVDGPDFDGHEVDFDEVAKRNQMYVELEKKAFQAYKERKEGAGAGSN
jgi:ferredoxin--NADP+ reductase